MGISVVTWTLGVSDSAAVTERAVALGLDGIQYAGDHRDANPEELRAKAQAAGLRVIAIDPINAGPKDPAQATQQAAIDYYKQVIDFAKAVGSVPVTLHGLSLWTANCADKTAARKRLVECCRAVDAYAQEQGVGTLYEVCNHYEVPLIHTAAECRQLISELGTNNLRMILDSFHMNIDERDPLQVLREHVADLAIYHISDSGRGGIGTGHIDFKAQHDLLRSAGFTGEVAVEPVLAHLTPSTPPASGEDNQALDEQIRSSAEQWRAYASHLA